MESKASTSNAQVATDAFVRPKDYMAIAEYRLCKRRTDPARLYPQFPCKRQIPIAPKLRDSPSV